MTLRALEKNWLALDEQSSVREHFPAWLEEHRSEQRAALMKHGIPSQRNERWKYTDLAILARQNFVASRGANDVSRDILDAHRMPDADAVLLVFIDGCFRPSNSDLDKLPKDVLACSMRTALLQHEALVKQNIHLDISAHDYPFAALNAAMFVDGLFLYIPDYIKLSTPLHILSLSSGQEAVITHTHHLLVLGQGSDITIMHEYASLREAVYFTNVMTTIAAQQGAKLNLVKIQHESMQAVHMENFFVRQAKDSDISLTHVTTGGQFSRDDTAVSLMELGALCRTSGFYHASRDGQYVDHHVDIKHSAPRTNSEMLYKGIADKKSRAVFNGGLYVEKDAQKINATQGNHNLLLSNQAEIYSKPELEIYADDVKCKHGATTGQIDQDALFYMRARGIDQATAMRILLKGFVDDVLQRITHPAIQQHAMKQVKFL